MKYLSPAQMAVFRSQVWDVVRQIPSGCVATYGQIARLVQPPAGVDAQTYLAFGARWVGTALAACPEDVPWQRVINAQGKISLRVGGELQRQLLEAEGVRFNQQDKVDLKQYGWK
ncbi:MAG: MGMT family protein [Chloroflexota bacterium]